MKTFNKVQILILNLITYLYRRAKIAIMKRLQLLTALLILPIILIAQSFEGSINYTISYSNLSSSMQQAESMLPKSQTIWIKDNMSRFEQKISQVSTVVITDTKAGTSTILMEMMGQKFKLSISQEEMQEMVLEQKTPTVKYVDGTREIAGYTCKKAEVIMEGFEGVTTFYYTEEIPAVRVKGMESLELKGMFMAYEAKMQDMTIKIEVTSINKGPVDDAKFIVPEGYSELPDQMKSLMGIK